MLSEVLILVLVLAFGRTRFGFDLVFRLDLGVSGFLSALVFDLVSLDFGAKSCPAFIAGLMTGGLASWMTSLLASMPWLIFLFYICD
jgi:hypothetical protein